MKLTIVGSSGSFAGPESPASCYLLQATHEGRTWSILLDLGSGALGALQRYLDPLLLDGVFISHLHPDHCIDLTGLHVLRRYHPEGTPSRPLPVWAPRETPTRAALMYHGIEDGAMHTSFEFFAVTDGSIHEVGPFTVESFLVRHPVETYGFRVSADNHVMSYTGDTDVCDSLSPLLRGSDLALVDCAFIDGRDDHHVGIHLTGSRAAAAAVRAGGVKHLVLTHIPPWNDPETCRTQAESHWKRDLTVARSGWSVELGDP